MDSRREFLKKAALLSGLAGTAGALPPSIQKAFAINPPKGTTWKDAEHVVILMQENRSFDHCYGTLRGVRGFNDPRAIKLPNDKPVWFQANDKGETYVPYRLNIKDTKVTWMGSLPHSWTDQVDARNNGAYDKWLTAKKSGRKEYSGMPLTLGYFNREDIPFYYSLADAFTVCDQNFCSSLTGTTPNRLHLWTGKIREDNASSARVRNEETDYGVEAAWKTFPELLEDNNVSWKIYQNEISVGSGLDGDEDAWLGNFTDNPIEWFSQYHVKFHPAYIENLPKKIEWLKGEIVKGEEKLKTLTAGTEEYLRLERQLVRGKKELETSIADTTIYTKENFDKLPEREKNLHRKAFTTNVKDPDYHKLETYKYNDGEMKAPKGDVFHQFRADVQSGNLPTVSWLVAPENFSDHPGAPWYGAWYLSESIDILTKNPDVWKKTIFILCYDENDGYFDHVPPFIPPSPDKPETGKVSKSIDVAEEWVSMQSELKRKPQASARENAIGLGYRVPLVIASPWSRGGFVNSQVFDHTSIIMFVEKFLQNKGKSVRDNNISTWRRSICGDLTTTFRPYEGEQYKLPTFVKKDEFFPLIHRAQFKDAPKMPTPVGDGKADLSLVPKQEPGTRPSSALPYQFLIDGKLGGDGKSFVLNMSARKGTVGVPFTVYSVGKNWLVRNYAVDAGDVITDSLPVDGDTYHIKAYGPNGYYREFKGDVNTPIEVRVEERPGTGKQPKTVLALTVWLDDDKSHQVVVHDNSYGQSEIVSQTSNAEPSVAFEIDLKKSSNWYDFTIGAKDLPGSFVRIAGRVETGKDGITDPAMA